MWRSKTRRTPQYAPCPVHRARADFGAGPFCTFLFTQNRPCGAAGRGDLAPPRHLLPPPPAHPRQYLLLEKKGDRAAVDGVASKPRQRRAALPVPPREKEKNPRTAARRSSAHLCPMRKTQRREKNLRRSPPCGLTYCRRFSPRLSSGSFTKNVKKICDKRPDSP